MTVELPSSSPETASGKTGVSMGIIVSIFFAPALIPLVMIGNRCFPIPRLDYIYFVVGIASAIGVCTYHFHTLKRRSFGVNRYDVDMNFSWTRVVARLMVTALGTFLIAGIASWVLARDLVMLTAHERREYVATLQDVAHGGRGCYRDVEFVDPDNGLSISICGSEFISEPKIGERIKVVTLSGSWGVRIISIER
jgi:hypothetical protein